MTETRPAHVWHSRYTPDVDPHLVPPTWTVLDRFLELARDEPDAPCLHYFGRTLTRADLADLAGRIAAVWSSVGVGTGDRVAISLQNTPVFPAALLASWTLGASVVPVNPMLRPDELTPMLLDSGAVVLVAHPAMAEVVRTTCERLDDPPALYWSRPDELAGSLPIPFPSEANVPSGGLRLLEQARSLAGPLRPAARPGRDDVALITYTSGTTGPSKGAVGTHANLAVQAIAYEQWFGCDRHTSVLAVAPLFHITGLGAHLALALGMGHPLVLTHRFEPSSVLGLVATYEPTYALGAITAFISLLDVAVDGPDLPSLATLYSGGAPVPSEVVERFEKATGCYIHNIYGLTETTSACIATPLGLRAPVEEDSGALSIGVPMGGTVVRIVDDSGQPVAAGEQGEIVVSGPQVAVGYWQRPEETERTFRHDGVHTGDVGVMDEEGWVYVVDRKKDLVVVSGYKVWPREVEDVLYRHPAVREAAVVGRPDDYRGETVHAFVTLRPSPTTSAEALREWCRQSLAAYKVPSEVVVLDEIPKTPTGKILRRSLRD